MEHEGVESRLSGELLQAFLKHPWKRSRKVLEPVSVILKIERKAFCKVHDKPLPHHSAGLKNDSVLYRCFANSVTTLDAASTFMINPKSPKFRSIGMDTG